MSLAVRLDLYSVCSGGSGQRVPFQRSLRLQCVGSVRRKGRAVQRERAIQETEVYVECLGSLLSLRGIHIIRTALGTGLLLFVVPKHLQGKRWLILPGIRNP